MTQPARRALVLARGAGTRMQSADGSARLTAEQEGAAASGQKAFMPIAGRPFLGYVIDALTAAGVQEIGLVVADHHVELGPSGHLSNSVHTLTLVVQSRALGTADAVWSARDWAAGEPFLVLNGDNLYPSAAVGAVASADGPALAGFDRDDLVATSNISRERINAFAVLERDAHGNLQRIVEKPSAAVLDAMPAPVLVSMNLWKFDARIFDACRDVTPSARGELELPAAVMLARRRGVSFEVVPSVGPVLDLSSRGDIAAVARRLGAAQ